MSVLNSNYRICLILLKTGVDIPLSVKYQYYLEYPQLFSQLDVVYLYVYFAPCERQNYVYPRVHTQNICEILSIQVSDSRYFYVQRSICFYTTYVSMTRPGRTCLL